MHIALKPVQLFAIEYNGVHVGNVGVHPMDDVYCKSAEIGYFLGEEYWNKGIMSRAVKLAVDYAFAELDVVRIFTGIFDYNTASGRVLEKCGFRKEAVFEKAVFKNGNFYDEIRYAIIKKS
jgi:RimJ/RimL family protein N-acetyltransferase